MVSLFRRYGMPQAKAHALVADLCDRMWEKGWRDALQKAVARRAWQYEKKWGDLGGFKPEVIGALFIPFSAALFGDGNLDVVQRMAQMRKEHEDGQA